MPYVDGIVLPYGLMFLVPEVDQQAGTTRLAKLVRLRFACERITSEVFIRRFEDHILAQRIYIQIAIDRADGTIACDDSESI